MTLQYITAVVLFLFAKVVFIDLYSCLFASQLHWHPVGPEFMDPAAPQEAGSSDSTVVSSSKRSGST